MVNKFKDLIKTYKDEFDKKYQDFVETIDNTLLSEDFDGDYRTLRLDRKSFDSSTYNAIRIYDNLKIMYQGNDNTLIEKPNYYDSEIIVKLRKPGNYDLSGKYVFLSNRNGDPEDVIYRVVSNDFWKRTFKIDWKYCVRTKILTTRFQDDIIQVSSNNRIFVLSPEDLNEIRKTLNI